MASNREQSNPLEVAVNRRQIGRIVLVSGSPRRRALLDQLGVSFTVYQPNADESAPRGIRPAAYVREVARRKLRAYIEGSGRWIPGIEPSARGSASGSVERAAGGSAESTGEANGTQWALAADTTVAVGRRIIGKPEDRREAEAILRLLSGRGHNVITAIALFNPQNGRVTVESERTRVIFATLSEEEITWYLDSGEWRDVAGGYRIQERGSVLVRRIVGSYSNVVGLPIQLFYGMVQSQGYNLFPVGKERIR